MNNFVKAAIGIGVVGAVAGIAYIVSKKKEGPFDIFDEEKKDDQETEDEDQEESEKEPEKKDTIFTKVKKKIVRISLKTLLWISEHQDQIEALGTLIGLGVGIFNFVTAVKDFKNGNKMQEQIDDLVRDKEGFKEAWNATQNASEQDMRTLMDEFKDVKSMLSERAA